jgi:hypothetical protein
MSNADTEALEGITLSVYLYVAKKGKPVGPRDVMKGINLSSPSVAYRHLQKLEDLEYLTKNEFGEYVVKKKAAIKGRVWLGHTVVSKMWLYALVFFVILFVELAIFFIHFSVETYEFKVFFLLLTLITGLAFGVFAVEGVLNRRKNSSFALE